MHKRIFPARHLAASKHRVICRVEPRWLVHVCAGALNDAHQAGIGIVSARRDDSHQRPLVDLIHNGDAALQVVWIVLSQTEGVDLEIADAELLRQAHGVA